MKIKESDLYKMYLVNPPARYDAALKKHIRRSGSSFYEAFWKGYDGITPVSLIKGSFYAQAFWSGVEYKKLGGKDYPEK
jgi:hypothetical protein